MMALPDKTIAARIDRDPGGMSGAKLENFEDGILIASLNVQSMRGDMSAESKGKGKGRGKGKRKSGLTSDMLNGTSKKAIVLHQLGKRRVHAAGIQEARGFKDGISVDDGFLVCSSAATSAGSFGCALALNTKEPWFKYDGKDIFVGRQDVAIVHASPRLLLVTVSTRASNMLFVVPHGPLPTSTDETIAVFWPNVYEEIHKHAAGRSVIMCADANATIAVQDGSGYGTVLSHKPNKASEAFKECLTNCKLWAPATFKEYATLCDSTSFPKSGSVQRQKGERVDFVCVWTTAPPWYRTRRSRGQASSCRTMELIIIQQQSGCFPS